MKLKGIKMYSIIKKIIPKPIKRKIYSYIKEDILKKNNLYKSLNYELKNKHIANLKAILNRNELLKLLPKNGVVAELGVDTGDFSQQILNFCCPQKLHLIDYWGTQRYNQEKRNCVEEKFKNIIDKGIVEINLGLSTNVVEIFKDNYFDWVYIDTNHSYDTTVAELESYRGKMKNNGIIAGHDYIQGNWEGGIKYGVIDAVQEFCIKWNWEIIYLTMENKIHPSFAIRKINNK